MRIHFRIRESSIQRFDIHREQIKKILLKALSIRFQMNKSGKETHEFAKLTRVGDRHKHLSTRQWLNCASDGKVRPQDKLAKNPAFSSGEMDVVW